MVNLRECFRELNAMAGLRYDIFVDATSDAWKSITDKDELGPSKVEMSRKILSDGPPDWVDDTDTNDDTEDSTPENSGNWLEDTLEDEEELDDQGHDVASPKAQRNSRKTLTITHYECNQCSSPAPQSYHPACDAPIIYVDKEWQCGGCGVQFSPDTTCDNCGAALTPDTIAVPLDVSHPASPSEIETVIHEETNQRRTDHGVGTLDYSQHLSAIALQHSRDMAQRDFFDHTSPDGADANDRYGTFGHDRRSSGENIALTHPSPTESVHHIGKSVVDDWMNSEGHRKNILRDQFEREGIGVYITSDGSMYSTQNFY